MKDEKYRHHIAVCAFVVRDGKVLIVKRKDREIAFPGKWAYPGGKLEKGETIFQALKRETKEETGLDIEDSKELLFDWTFVRPDGYNVVAVCFKVIPKEGGVNISKDFTDFAWVGPEDIDKYDYIKGMKEQIKSVLK